ncbi:MAG: IPT/TIG domain-containing protein [Bacteroidota bacterium]|nr:IPT/TIG domain-containing protein [Bacteroidota bacterium]
MSIALRYGYRCKLRHRARLTMLSAAALLLAAGCDFGPAASLHDPDRISSLDPVIDSVSPAGLALAGVDLVTIIGQNFSGDIAGNLVYFGQSRGTILEASPTQMSVLPPNAPMQNLLLRVSVIGAENFSNGVTYSLDAAAAPFGSILSFEDVFSITTDLAGHIYISLISDARPVGIERLDAEGTRSRFAQSGFGWADMAFGPDGQLYTVRAVRAVFRFTEGSSQMTWVVIPDVTVKLSAVAVDASGVVWVAGDNAHIYSLSPDKSVQMHAFEANVRDLALADDYLYAVGEQQDRHAVWRFARGAGAQLGPAEEILDIAGQGGRQGLSVAVATSGHVYVGTDATDPVILVDPDGTAEPLYPGILTSPASKMAWGPSGYLYVVRDRSESLDPTITRVNTRREGVRFF